MKKLLLVGLVSMVFVALSWTVQSWMLNVDMNASSIDKQLFGIRRELMWVYVFVLYIAWRITPSEK